MTLVAYAWLAIATPAPKCILREVYAPKMPGRCILWSSP